MAEHSVDIHQTASSAAGLDRCAGTIDKTVNGALRRAAAEHDPRVVGALDILADADLAERSEAWR